jgi:hypothetical protein
VIGDVAAGNAVSAVSPTAEMLAIPSTLPQGPGDREERQGQEDTPDRRVCHRAPHEPVGGRLVADRRVVRHVAGDPDLDSPERKRDQPEMAISVARSPLQLGPELAGGDHVEDVVAHVEGMTPTSTIAPACTPPHLRAGRACCFLRCHRRQRTGRPGLSWCYAEAPAGAHAVAARLSGRPNARGASRRSKDRRSARALGYSISRDVRFNA